MPGKRPKLHILRATPNAARNSRQLKPAKWCSILVRTNDQPRRTDGKRDRNTDQRPQSFEPGKIAIKYVERNQRRENEDRNEQRVDQNADATAAQNNNAVGSGSSAFA